MRPFNSIFSLTQSAFHNKTIVNGSLFSLFSFFGQGISFVLLVLLAHYILPNEYGLLSLFTTIVTFVGIVIAFSTRGYPGVTYFKKDSEGFKKDFTATVVLGTVTLLLLVIIVLLFGGWLSGILGLSNTLLWYVLIIAFFSFTFLLQQDYLRIKEKVASYGFYNCGLAILNFVLSVLFVITFKQGWMGRVNAWVLGSVIFGVTSCFFFFKNDLIRPTQSRKVYQDALAWGVPMIPHSASTWLRQGADTYIINFFHTTYAVGIFNFAMTLSNIIVMIGTAFNSTNSVTLFQILSDKTLTNEEKKVRLNRQTRMTFWIYVGATLAVLLLMTFISYTILPKYIESVPIMWILAISALGNCIYFLYCNYLFYYNETKNLMYITFGTSVAHFFLSLVLTRYSLYITACIYGVMMMLMTCLVIRRAKKLIKIYLQ